MEMNPQQMQDRARELADNVLPQLDPARRNLEDFNTRAITFIRATPGTCLVGAVALGFLIGRLASRR